MIHVHVPGVPEPTLLRDYQVAAIIAAEADWLSGKSPLLVLATGLGKTTIFVEAARRHLSAFAGLIARPRVLVLVHLREIVHQIADRFGRQAGLAATIEMGTERADDSSPVVVGSIQTVVRRPERWGEDEFSLIVFDEAHHGEADSYREVRARFPRALLMGVSATPERPDRKGLRLFDSIPFVMGVREGIASGYLATPIVESIKLAEWSASDQGKRGNVDGVRDWKSEALEDSFLEKGVAVPVAHAIAERRTGRKTLAFLPGVRASKRLTEALLALGERAEHLDGATSDKARDAIVARFRSGETQILTNCAVLTEGVDIPDIGCVALVRPTFNKTAALQCVGRGLRPLPTKSDCLVLDFTLSGDIDTGVDVKKALFGSSGGMDVLPSEASDNPWPEAPPPDARFPWASPEDAAAFAFRFTTQAKLFFRGRFVDRDALIALSCSRNSPEAREERTFEGWCRAVNFYLGETSRWGLSESQANLLRRLVPGLRDKATWLRSSVSARSVDEAIALQKKREKAKLCSLATSWTLWRFGFRPNLPKFLAEDLVETIFESDDQAGSTISPDRITANVERAKLAFQAMESEAYAALSTDPLIECEGGI